jgi:hypothetical protein
MGSSGTNPHLTIAFQANSACDTFGRAQRAGGQPGQRQPSERSVNVRLFDRTGQGSIADMKRLHPLRVCPNDAGLFSF